MKGPYSGIKAKKSKTLMEDSDQSERSSQQLWADLLFSYVSLAHGSAYFFLEAMVTRGLQSKCPSQTSLLLLSISSSMLK